MSMQPSVPTPAHDGRRPLAVFVAVGPRLIHYELDVESAQLRERDGLSFPANIQYAWPHASGDFLYVASSDGGPGVAGSIHHLSAVSIDSADGAMRPWGEARALPHRPVHMCVDPRAGHALIAYNQPSRVSVHRINRDGTLGDEVPQEASLEFGFYAHQVRVGSHPDTAYVVTRGNDAAAGKPEDPGALKVFDYRAGVLTNEVNIAPGGGYGFGPRHLDMHPRQPWLYVSLERQNKLCVFGADAQTRLHGLPLFTKDTLQHPDVVHERQMAGAIHMHPSGRFVYLANRALGTTLSRGQTLSGLGETNIAVYSVDQQTGEPTLIQHVETHGAHPRTFTLDPDGRVLIAANSIPLRHEVGGEIAVTPPNLAVFRIGTDGQLTYVRSYAFAPDSRDVFWIRAVG